MNELRWMGVLIFFAITVGLIACNGDNDDCEPESDAELCGDDGCGVALLTDRCGDEREVDCQGCTGEEECIDNQCQCPGESEEKLCDDYELDCGAATVLDACDNQREIACGGCQNAQDECIDNACVCEARTEQELCEDEALQCGEATITDGCGDERQLDCGDCPDSDVCTDNICECQGESDDALCDDHGVECGTTTVTDQCEQERQIDCSDCSGPEECLDNICVCEPPSDDELCATVDGACGTMEVTDECGDERSIECDPCPVGDTTFGAVRDGDSGALLGDAEIRVYTWPPPEGESEFWAWPEGHRAGDPDFSTTTSSSPDHDYNYEFATDEAICIDDQIASLEAQQWYRFVVERPGYDPGIFYRLHEGYGSEDCASTCSASGPAGCNRMDFELWPDDSPYAQRPNLVVDPRDLDRNEWQCALMPDDASHDELIGLRVRVGAANAGPGPLHLEGTDTGGGQVIQHIPRSDGSSETSVVESGTFEFHEGHQHIHFMNWFRLDLVDRRDECLDVDDRPSDCSFSDGLKISYCLHDLDPFDRDVGSLYGGMSALFPDPPTCDTTEQGVTQGWKDTYNRQLPGQVIIVGPPSTADAIDDAYIEAEVDPDVVLEEVERYGNVARTTVSTPSSFSALCSNPTTTLDCSMPSSDYTTTRQRRQCPGYLDF